MTDDEAEQRLTIINRLLASFPATASGSGDEALDGYLIAVSDVPARFLAAASARFLQGSVDGHNKKFAPSPAELSSEARTIWSRERKRLQAEEQDRLQIAARPQKLTEDELAHRKAFVADLLKTLPRTPDSEADNRKSKMEATNEMFRARDERDISERLNMGRWK